MRIEGAGYINEPYIITQIQNKKVVETPQSFSKDQMMQILNFMVYQQNGLAMKLVRVATENYLKAQMNQLV
ncbi:MAG: hypothetical protein ACK40Q_01130 [Pseudothermotoga sp.]